MIEAPVAAALITGGVTAASFWVVHALSVRRQRRDEFFKICQSTMELIHEVAKDAAEAWRKPGNDPQAIEIADLLPARIARIGKALAALHRRRIQFDLTSEMARFRVAVTRSIEDRQRQADSQRATNLLGEAVQLQDAIDRRFFAIFG